MIENVTVLTQYNDIFIPFSLFIIIFCAGLAFMGI